MTSLTSRIAGSSLGKKLLSSPLAGIAAFPWRLGAVAKANAKRAGAGARWLFGSRENTNYTYNLTERNLEHLAWFVSTLVDIPVSEARGYMQELLDDDALKKHVADAIQASPQRWLADSTARFGRRVGWYAIVRARKPKNVVETGTDKGLGALVLAAAVMRNGTGRLTTIDINPDSGYLISGVWAEVTNRVIGDGVETITNTLSDVDFFIHDSDHSSEYEKREFVAIGPKLTKDALVLSDNAHASDSLLQWAEETGRHYLYFGEEPLNHWYPGASIGVAFR